MDNLPSHIPWRFHEPARSQVVQGRAIPGCFDHPSQCMRREAIQSVKLSSTSGVVCTEMVYKLKTAGYRFTETPVHHYPRLHGQSQFFTLRRVARTGFDFFKLWLRLVIGWRLIFGLDDKRKSVVETTSA